MTHEVTWLVPDSVVMATLKGAITADEVQMIADKMYKEIDSVTTEALVHLLIDVRECTLSEKVWEYAKLNLRRHPHYGWAIVIGDSRLGGLVIAIFSKLVNSHIRYSETLESALKFLSERDLTVDEYLKR